MAMKWKGVSLLSDRGPAVESHEAESRWHLFAEIKIDDHKKLFMA